MTNEEIELVEQFKIELRSYVQTDGWDSNLFYSVKHKDGEISHIMGKVCWANIHYYMAKFDEDIDEEYGDEHPWEESFVTGSMGTHLVFSIWGCKINPDRSRGDWGEYRNALQSWAELFSPIIKNHATVWQDQYILIELKGIDVDCLGACLVGYRNLAEQSYFRQFNMFVQAGFSLPVAAFLTQVFAYDKVRDQLIRGHTNHNTMSQHRPYNLRIPAFVEAAQKCKLYDQKQMVTGEELEDGPLDWSIGNKLFQPNMNPYGSHPSSVWDVLTNGPAGVEVTDQWSKEKYKVLDATKTIQALKEIFNVE